MQTLTLEKTTARDVTLVLLASFAICLSGQLTIPLWFTPVPLAVRPSLILLLAALLGSRRGAAATFAFLVQGALGLPVFMNGAAGIQPFFGPVGGYLIGYLIASFVVGYMVENRKNLIVSFIAGNLIIYLCGSAYLATFVGMGKAILLGVVPFILGDLLKTALSIKLMSWLKRD